MVVYCKTSVCVHKLHLAPLPIGRGIAVGNHSVLNPYFNLKNNENKTK